jgi:hypothetical protein
VIKHRQFTKGQKIFVIMGIFVCGLLFYANGVASNLISAPTYVGDIITFSALTVAVALTVITLTIVIRDKRRSLFAKKQKSIVANSDKESIEIPSSVLSSVDSQENTDKVESDIVAVETVKVPDKTPVPVARSAKVFGKRNLFVIIVVLVVGLLLVANAGAFGLISLPQYSIYATLAGAIAIATIPLTILLSDKIKALGHRIKNFWAEPDIQEIIKEVKEPDQVPDIAPVIAQTSTIKVDPYTEMLRQFRVQKTSRKFEADNAEQEQLPKKPVIPPTKVICPACRKEFSLPIYERNYIVDFGQPKRSNPIERCPHCQTSIPLKRRGAVEEDDMWKD